MHRQSLRFLLGLLMAVALLAGWSGVADAYLPPIGPGDTPDYLTTPNWANTPPIRKFIDNLPQLDKANNLGQSLPVAVPDQATYPGSDYYIIKLVQFEQKNSTDLPPTTLRGYVQMLGDGTPPTDPNYLSHLTESAVGPQFLGPVIVAQKDRPVRVLFINGLGLGPDGDLFIPVDQTIMGSGDYEIDFDPITKQPLGTIKTGKFSQNRGELHLHGGRTPWISDGTPHQWITPAGENPDYSQGVSVVNVPDMPDPGPGAQTYYWTNQQSARFMFYHDHAWGITRLNVYVGEAAGYMIQDQTEADLVNAGLIPANQIPLVIEDKTYVDADPLSPTYVLKTDPTWRWGTGLENGTISEFGQTVPVHDPKAGDLWWPHVYMPAQNPFDISGIAPMGRWAYGPYFWPATNNRFQPVPNPYYNPDCDAYKDSYPVGAPDGLFDQRDIDLNKTNDAGYTTIPIPGAVADPVNFTPVETPYCQPPEIPGTPNPSWGAEAFMDTPTVNGTAYPVLTVEPKPYRFRILNAAHDRFFSLNLYKADTVNQLAPVGQCSGVSGSVPCSRNTEVAMIDASGVPPTGYPAWPATWPADGRPGGVPDYTMTGPDWIQIGTEGGFLPQPVVIPAQPVTWNMDVTTFNAGNVNGGSLIVGPAERVDVVVDFSTVPSGTELILYNDAPAPWPALDPHYDYFTGAPDMTEAGGAAPTLPGMGPNTRTVMKIVVQGAAGAAFNLANLQKAFKGTADAPAPFTNNPAFRDGQDDMIVGQSNLNPTGDPAHYEAFLFNQDYSAISTTYKQSYPSTYPNWGIARINDKVLHYKGATGTTDHMFNNADTATHPLDNATMLYGGVPLMFKAIQDEQGETFDDYGRMRAGLGLEQVNPGAGVVNFFIQTYSDPATEVIDPAADGGLQIWKITHNGVDTHPIHFHLYDVQVINRVGWDGFIRLPDPNELGWKDTLRVSPLEDTIVALRPVTPRLPFGVPESQRPLNPAHLALPPSQDTTELTQINPFDGSARINYNQIVNIDWEYVWHCHILSHEENDMMRPQSFLFQELLPDAPNLQSANVSLGQVALTWTDPTPVTYTDPANFVSNPQSEIGFIIERNDGGGFLPHAYALANATTFNDVQNMTPGASYDYRIRAYNAAGQSDPSNELNVTAPLVVLSAPANGATFIAPADITVSADAAPSITTVTFYDGASPIGTDNTAPFSISWNGVAAGNYTLTAVGNGTATSAPVSITVLPGIVDPPGTLSFSPPSPSTTGSYTVQWSASPTAGAMYVLDESTTPGFDAGTVTQLLDGTTSVTSSAVSGKTNGTYYYRVQAVKPPMQASTWVTGNITVSLPPINVALQANGGVATASSFYSTGTPPAAVNNGDRKGLNYGTGGVWFDKTPGVYPDWVQVTFNGQKTINEIDVFTVQDNLTAPVDPTLAMTFTKYGTTSLLIQYWDGTAWQTLPGGTITGNNLVWRQVTFTPVSTDKIRVQVNASLGNYSRLAEIEAWGWGGAIVVPPPTPSATVALTSPTNGAIYNGVPATIPLAATVTESNGWTTDIVEFYNGATLIGSDTTAPYTFSWTGVGAGSYSITAKAIDNPSGSSSTSAAVSVSAVAIGGIPQNVALQANGGVATASTFYSTGTPPSAVTDGDRKGLNYGTGGVWFDKTPGVYPDWVEVAFNGTKTINEIDVFTVQDNLTAPSDPTLAMTFTKYGTTSLLIQYWDGTAWQTLPGGTITGNNLVWRQVTFTPVATGKIRVQVNASLGNYSRLVEIEAWTP